jgi:hypothetical protein
MPTPSGQISLIDIQTEFGGGNPTSINEYYSGGSYVRTGIGVPASGQISFDDLRNKSLADPTLGVNWKTSSGILIGLTGVLGQGSQGNLVIGWRADGGIHYSLDRGDTWITAGTIVAPNGYTFASPGYGYLWNGSKFILGGVEGSVWTSANGAAWSPAKRTFFTAVGSPVGSAAYPGGFYNHPSYTVGFLQNDKKVATSTDNGDTWTGYSTTFTGVPLSIVVGGTAGVWPGAGGQNNRAFGNGIWVLCAARGHIAYSTDGINYTYRGDVHQSFGGDNILSVVFNGTEFVVAGSSGHLATSPDGITWTYSNKLRLAGVTFANTIFQYNNKKYVAGGSGYPDPNVNRGTLFISTDLISWTKITALTAVFGNQNVFSIAESNGRWITNVGTAVKTMGISP